MRGGALLWGHYYLESEHYSADVCVRGFFAIRSFLSPLRAPQSTMLYGGYHEQSKTKFTLHVQ